MIDVAVYDSKPHDREFLTRASAGQPIVWHFLEFRLEPANASSAAGCKVACLFVNDRADSEALRRLSEAGVELIAMRCAGYNNLDLAAARAQGVRVVRVPAYSPHAVAEHTVGLLLTLNRKIHRAYNRVREHNFSLQGLMGFDLAGKTAGVLGTGKIGQITAQILRGFDMQVLACDPKPDRAWAEAHQVTYCPHTELLEKADVISLHLPLLPDTFHILDKQAFARMKAGALVVNTSRGKLIDTAALIEALKSHHLGGVALDVYEEEEGVFFEDLSEHVLGDDVLSRLLTFPNVLVTAHQAFFTREALQQISAVTVENIARFEKGAEFLDGTSL